MRAPDDESHAYVASKRWSVVVPTFDTAAMTLACCRAVLDQSPAPAEVIVADDGSSDGTAELLARELPDVRVVRLETNRGFAPAANAGVAAARGDFVLLLNSDAIAGEGALQALTEAFDDPALGVAGARLLHEDGAPQWSGGKTPALAWMIGVVSGLGPLARLVRRRGGEQRDVDWVSGAAMAFRAEVWRDAGPLSERFLFYCQDIEFCLRARAAGWRVRVVERAKVTHRLGATAGEATARLWPDLLTWGRAHHGVAWGHFARVVLIGVAALRIAARVLIGRDTSAMRAAVRAMRRS